MELVFLVAITIGVWLVYSLGKTAGRKEVLRSAIGVGTWIEVERPVRAVVRLGEPRKTIPVGTQGIVKSVDRWGKIGIWFATPWVDVLGFTRASEIENIQNLRVIPLTRVDTETKDETFKRWLADEEQNAEMVAQLFPPGFLELNRMLNR